MLTLIELFDREMAENVASILLLRPEKVIFLGYKGQMYPRHTRALQAFLWARNLPCQTEFYTVDRYDKTGIQETLLTVLQKNPACVFDVTGGGELALIAMGELSRHMGISMHQVSPETGRILAVNGEAPQILGSAELTVQENMLLHGGRFPHHQGRPGL